MTSTIKPYILGLRPNVADAPFLSSEELFKRVGGNTGNLAFHYALDRLLGCNLPVVDWGAPSIADTSGDIAVVPCANQLGEHVDLGGIANKFGKIKSPIVAIGLGAQSNLRGDIPSIPAGTIEWLKTIIDHAPTEAANITVRGEFTYRVMERYGLSDSAVILGCPSLFINPSNELGKIIAKNIREPKRIAVAASHRWEHLAELERSLAKLVAESGGSYIGQSPLEMIKLTRGEAKLLSGDATVACKEYICPNMTLSEFIDWTERYAHVFFDVPSWMEHYRRFDFVIGARIHGIMLALQAGVPALCIVHDSRTLELCQTMRVPYVLAKDVINGVQREDLLKLFKFDPDEFDNNRRMLAARFVAFLKNNQLQPVKWLEELAAVT